MKKTSALIHLALGLAASTALGAGFTAGNVVALQIGTANHLGTAGTLREFTPAGAAGTTVTLPNSGITDDGVSSIVFCDNSGFSHGLNLSYDNALLVIPGFANASASATLDGVAGTASPRVVGIVKYDGTYTRPFSSTTAFSGVGFRYAASEGFGNFWGMGNGGGGTRYLNTDTSVQASTGRAVKIANGNLYYAIGASVNALPGLPQTPSSGSLIITPSGASPSIGSFALPENPVVGSRAYVADTVTGVQRFDWNGSAYVYQYTILMSGSLKPQHLTADYSGATPVIYAVNTTGASLQKLVDNGPAATDATVTVLATPAGGNLFRGVALAPRQPAAPVFATPPQGQTNEYGASVSFGPVAATGANPNGFTWMRYGTNLIDGATAGGSVISGSTSNTLTVSGIGLADRTFYYAVAHNNGTATTPSSGAFLELIGSCINPKPLPATLCAGSTAHFSGGTSGCQLPLQGISWTYNGGFGEIPVNDGPGFSSFSTISGATTTSLAIANVQDGDAGVYKLTVIDAVGNPSVASAALTVADSPGFTQQPASQSKLAGQTANFTVVASGNALSYYWKKDTNPINDGATGNGSTRAGTHTATLWITNVVGQDVGSYTCMASNVCSTATSDPAPLTVGFPVVFTNPPAAVLISTGGLTAVLTGQASGTPTIAYSWKFNGTPLVNDGVHIFGADTDTLTIANVQIADAGTYTLTGNNDYNTAIASSELMFVYALPKPHTVPGLVIYESFDYPIQAYPGFPAPAGWINSWQNIISAWNEVTGQPAYWERLGGPYCTTESSTTGGGNLCATGQYPWKGIDCSATQDRYWSSAPNNNHLNFGGVDQTNGAAYFSLILHVSQGSAFAGGVYDLIAGLTTGVGAANADNWVYKLATHSTGGDTYRLGVFKGGGSGIGATSLNGQWAEQDLGRGSVHFIVGCYKFNSGTNLVGGSITNNDVLSLWIDPDRSTFGAAEGAVPAVNAGGMVTNWNANAPITEFALKGTVEPASKRMTDLRIGTTWASVTKPYYPKLKISKTTTDVTVSWPAKDSPYDSGTGLYQGYFLQSAANLTDWANDLSGVALDGTGTNLTVTESLGAAQFFRLKLP